MSEFVGREAEIDLLARRVAAGVGPPLLLTGPPRIGRTSLLREFRQRRGPRAEEGGVLLARVACRTAGISPLHLATAVAGELALRCALADELDIDRERLLDPHTFPRVAETFPVRAIADFARAVASFSRGTRKGPAALLRATANLAELTGEARDCWVALLLDDLAALCNPRTQAFVAALADAMVAGRRLLCIATARDGAETLALTAPGAPLHGRATVHALGPLDEASGDALVLRMGSRAGLYPSQAVLERVQELCAGHPFYIRALCDSVLAHFDRESRLSPEAIDAAFAAETLHPQGRIALHCAEQAGAAIEAAGGGSTTAMALAALAQADRPTAAGVSSRLRGGTRPVRPAAEALLKSDCIARDAGPVRFADPVVRFWCATALVRDRLADLDRPESVQRLVREFASRFRSLRAGEAPNFRGLAALCAGRNLPGDFFSARGTVQVPKFQRIQGYAFAERDMKLYALEIAPEDDTGAAPRNGDARRWTALFVWRDIELGQRQIDVLLRWLNGRTEKIWVVARRGIAPEAADQAEAAGLFVSDESDLEALARHLGAAQLDAGRTGQTAKLEPPQPEVP